MGKIYNFYGENKKQEFTAMRINLTIAERMLPVFPTKFGLRFWLSEEE